MAKRTPTGSAGRTLAWLAALLVVLAAILGGGVASGAASWAPKLALDLEGGTQMVLAPQTSTGESVTPEQLDQAVEIIRQRVDGSGVAEAEVATQGSQNVVVSLPGVPDEETRRLIQASADMQFRPVLQSGPGEATPEDQRLPEDQLPKPDGEPADAYDPNWVTPALLAEFQATDCTAPRDPAAPPPPSDRAIVACQPSEELADGAVTPAQKYILGPVVIPGTQIKGASNGMAQAQGGVSTNQWVVNIEFDEEGTKAFTEVTQKLTPYPEGDPRKQFAILLDGDVISAPQSNVVITNGSAQISGPTLNEQTTAQLAEQLNYGSLPISFSIESEQQISATLGRDQLFWGLIAGLIGLGLVAVYQFFQYRALGLLTFASIIVAGVLTWLTIAILGWTDNYRLSLAGIAGLIVAIGLTADSFIVYFERIKDELRAGHTVPVAVHEGWKRARRTITASKAVNLLAAVVLYFVAVGNVRGFNLGIEFRGGSEFTVSQTASTDVAAGERAVTDVLADGHATVTNVAPGTVRVQTEQLDDAQTRAVAANLQEAYGVGQDQVTSTFVGPTWGAAVSQQALIGLVIFVVLVTLFMAVYFRTWKMSLAAVLGMLYVVALTAGIYGATGFEITPSAIIGFLTILSYALYDTVVVFDKIRENTIGAEEDPERSFVENVNLAVNQTLVRSITTSVVGILPVGSILFIGAGLLGAGTLRDIALALFVGIIVGTLSTLFLQAPLYALLRRNDPDVRDHDARAAARAARERASEAVTDPDVAPWDDGARL